MWVWHVGVACGCIYSNTSLMPSTYKHALKPSCSVLWVSQLPHTCSSTMVVMQYMKRTLNQTEWLGSCRVVYSPCSVCVSHKLSSPQSTRNKAHLLRPHSVSHQCTTTKLCYEANPCEVLGAESRVASSCSDLGDVNRLAQQATVGSGIAKNLTSLYTNSSNVQQTRVK